MVRFRLFFRDGNLPQENKPLPKEPDERKKTKTPKSKVLSLYDISQCFVSEILRVGTIVYYDKNLSYCSLFYSENRCKMLSFLETFTTVCMITGTHMIIC